MNVETAVELAERIITRKERHSDYNRCVEIAHKSRVFVTGEGQGEDYLLAMRDKENERQKQIRVKVTKPITPLAINPVRTEYAKISRVDGVTRSIDGNDLTDLNEALETFHSNASLDNYLERRYVHWNFLDPNGWLVAERRNVYDEVGKVERVDIYPLEVTSKQAIHYNYDNGVPQWLMVKQERIEVVTEVLPNGSVKSAEQEVDDYFFYAAGIALRYSEYIQTPPDFPGAVPITLLEDGESEPERFMFASYETGTTEFPGHKWGAYDDQDGDGTVKVPPFWDGARFLLEDLIETKSVFDVSKHNHVFPRLFHYEQRCKHMEGAFQCSGGKLVDSHGNGGGNCPACNGTGGNLHFGESDIITFEMPANMEDLSRLPPLASLAYYHQPPLDVTKALYEWVQDFKEQVYIASFNSSNVDKAMVAKTATEVSKLWDDINTRIYPCASWMSRLYEKIVRVSAQYLEKEVKVRHSFPRDMKLEPLEVVMQRYKDSEGLPYDVRQSILFAVLGKTFLDNPKKAENIKAWEYWRPFKSMSQETVLFILQDRANDDFDKLLFQNWDNVQIDVEKALGETDFSDLTMERQYQAIKQAIEAIKPNIKFLDSGQQFPDFTALDFNQDSLTSNQNQDGNQGS